MTYSEKLKDPRWQRKRLEIMQRDEFTCQDCCQDDKTLNVHHMQYLSKTAPWDYPNNLLRTVCEDCHVLRQNLEKRAHIALARILAHACAGDGPYEWPAGLVGHLESLVSTLEEEARHLESDPDAALRDIVFAFAPSISVGEEAISICIERLGVGWSELMTGHLSRQAQSSSIAEQ